MITKNFKKIKIIKLFHMNKEWIYLIFYKMKNKKISYFSFQTIKSKKKKKIMIILMIMIINKAFKLKSQTKKYFNEKLSYIWKNDFNCQ